MTATTARRRPGSAATRDEAPGPVKKAGSSGAARGAGHGPAEVQAALAWLEQKSTQRDRENLARFGITANKAFGVSMANIQVLAKRLGRNHELAAALWETGWYEARMLASFVDEPARVTPAQMDRWCRDFDNWGICDTLCFHLFDRTPHAWAKVAQWSGKRDEFVKRAAFALLASLAVHDKSAGDEPFAREPAAHRARRHRRAELRQEGRELGAARDRQAQRRAQRRRGGGGPAPGGLTGGRGALGGEGRAQGAHEPCGDAQARRHEKETCSVA